jgi:sugar phosphate isomerase/epimerase
MNIDNDVTIKPKMLDKVLSRRDVLALIGKGTVAAIAFPSFGCIENTKEAKIGFQLYSIRRQIEKDFEGSIQKVSAMGYLGVETYPLPSNISIERAAKVFKDNGLSIISMHTELPIDDNLIPILRMAETFQCSTIVHSGWPNNLSTQNSDLLIRTSEIYDSVDKLNKRVNLYNEINASLNKNGLRFGIHNHWWEFERSNNLYPFYYFLERLDKGIFFEIDTYWIKTAGFDPVKAVEDFGLRAPFLHIKDGVAKKGSTMYSFASAGKGSLDYPSIIKSSKGNVQWMIVEFDEYAGDIFEGIQGSYSYLIKNGFAKGRE